ncbi:MAG: zinc-ribbon domain containing protein [Pirellulales bacterium]
MTRRRGKRKFSNPNQMPSGAMPADASLQVPNNSYHPPPRWYVDKPFTCAKCGSEEVWTAEQQKWYYEVAKGTLFATAKHCRKCRNRIREVNDEQRRKSESGKKPTLE